MLIEGAAAVSYARNPRGGFSIFIARGQLLARPFDPLTSSEFTGEPEVIAEM